MGRSLRRPFDVPSPSPFSFPFPKRRCELEITSFGRNHGGYMRAASPFIGLPQSRRAVWLCFERRTARATAAGTQWSALEDGSVEGMSIGPSTMVQFNDGRGEALYLGGFFHFAGGQPSSKIARWSRTGLLFADNFECSDPSRWSLVQP